MLENFIEINRIFKLKEQAGFQNNLIQYAPHQDSLVKLINLRNEKYL